jgi:hypothetical protein
MSHLRLEDVRYKRGAQVAFDADGATIAHLGYEHRLGGRAARLLRKAHPWLADGADAATIAAASRWPCWTSSPSRWRPAAWSPCAARARPSR